MQNLHSGLLVLFARWPECKFFRLASRQNLHLGQPEIFAFSLASVQILHPRNMQKLHAS